MNYFMYSCVENVGKFLLKNVDKTRYVVRYVLLSTIIQSIVHELSL
jgi:hypothetical protein